jgi:hypothetical protein
MSTFGLVHGGGLGAWCWEAVIPELEARGHRAAAVDLPPEDMAAGPPGAPRPSATPSPGCRTSCSSVTPSRACSSPSWPTASR